jgi:hypothetical protein
VSGGLIIILAVIVVVLVAGVLLAKKGFTRGTLPAKPSHDRPGTSSVGAQSEPGVSADPRAVGRPSERGYEQEP